VLASTDIADGDLVFEEGVGPVPVGSNTPRMDAFCAAR
jgi:hypothetical protein